MTLGDPWATHERRRGYLCRVADAYHREIMGDPWVTYVDDPWVSTLNHWGIHGQLMG